MEKGYGRYVQSGEPDAAVTGIAVTMMATMDVLQRASTKGLNLVITHEPTFYAHLDTPEGMPKAIQSGRRNGRSSKSTEWWFGGFTIIGICASRTELKQEWSIRSDGKNFRHLGTSIFCSSRDHSKKIGGGSGEQVGFVGCACSGRAGDEGDQGGI